MPHIADLLTLIGVPLLVALNAFFVAAEFSLVTIRWTRVEELVDEHKFGAIPVREAVERLESTIAATQLGITFTSLALGWIGEPAIEHILEPWFHFLPPVWNLATAHLVAVAIAFL